MTRELMPSTAAGDADPKPLVRVDGVSFAYGRQRVLAGVSLEIRAGELWFVLGANGVGKTTFVRMLLGLVEPASGSVSIDAALGRDRIGFVPQRCDWNRNMPTTVHEFVRLGLVGTSVDKQTAGEHLRQALEIVGLSGMESRRYWSLSDGLRQRASIARALIRRPLLLLLDEPTNGLDPATEEGVMHLLDRLNREAGLALLFVTHDVELAARYATHVALFHAGTVTSGQRDTVLNQENLRRVYGTDVEVHSIGGHR